jgi:hypothetical protein
VANVTEDGDCWLGTERSASSWGYRRTNWYVPGLKRVVHLQSHIMTWIIAETGETDVDTLWLMYQEFRESGLELAHECHTPECRRPTHLTPMTHIENCAQRGERRSPRIGAPEPCEVKF